MRRNRWSPGENSRWGAGLLVVVLASAATLALAFGWGIAFAADSEKHVTEDVDRSMVFVEKTVEATTLFNERKLPEALALFQELSKVYADLDEDGYIAMSLGDCLHAMGRDEEARKVYQTVAAGHAELKPIAGMRIREIDLAMPEVNEVLIEDLRRAAGAAGDNRASAQLQLGRALQKRAASLLKEAVATFRTTAEEGRDLTHPAQRTISNQAVILAEIHEDLASLIDRVEKTWGMARTLAEIIDSGSLEQGSGQPTAHFRAEWSSEAAADGQASDAQTGVQVTWGKEQDKPRVTVNGKTVKLDSTQALIIQRHQQRMNAVIQEALHAEQERKTLEN